MSILKFMPPKTAGRKPGVVFVQARISEELRDKVKVQLRKDKYSIQELIEKSFLAYLDEKSQKRSSK